MRSALNASKDIGVGVTDLVLNCESEPVMDAVCAAVVGSARAGRVLDAGSDREDRSSDVCFVVATHDGHSLKKHPAHSASLPNRVTSRHVSIHFNSKTNHNVNVITEDFTEQMKLKLYLKSMKHYFMNLD